MITYRIINNAGKPLKLIRNSRPMTLAEIAALVRHSKKK
jgi:hypothetical protein